MGNLNSEGVQQYVDFLTKLVLETAETDESVAYQLRFQVFDPC